jgi:hypothetical protein
MAWQSLFFHNKSLVSEIHFSKTGIEALFLKVTI